MQQALDTIQKHAKELKKLEQSENYLFEQLNNLPPAQVQALIQDYTSDNFKPVNLLRLDILTQLKAGVQVTPDTVEEIKQKILSKDEEYFAKYGDNLVQGLKNYPKKKRGPFVNWQRNFSLLFPLFYSGRTKEEAEGALQRLAKDLKKTLRLDQYKSHIVSFWGAQNFGSSSAWIALFPKYKVSHRKAYQLFLHVFSETVEAGIIAGWDINDKESNSLEKLNTIGDVVERLKSSIETTEKKNNALINYWRYAPGENGVHWDEFSSKNLAAIGWDDLGDLNGYDTESLAEALGVEDPNLSNQISSIENFRDASIGDVIIANKGKSKALGVGIITGEYGFNESRDEFKHVRKVNWLIKELVEFDKTIFRPDTFSPTLKWNRIKEQYIKANPDYEQIFQDLEAGKEVLPPPKAFPNESETQNFWWLNANPRIWSIASHEVGDIQSYTSHNEKNNKRRVYRYFEEVKPGDLVIGYESTPTKEIKAIFEITEGLHVDDEQGEIISFELKEIVKEPISWEELKETRELENCEVLNNNQGSLFQLKPEEFDIIRDLIDEKNIQSEKVIKEIDITEYSFLLDPDKPFIEQAELEDIIYSLEAKKNVVLQGPPGVGKTFVAKKIAYEMMKKTDDTKITMIQFHQSYSYEDFIQGIRPSEKTFKIKNGIFLNFCKKAEADPDNKYFFIIDEINRGNLSKIFGELMMLIEADKRGKYSLPLTYSEKDDAPFSVPSNLYLIGTMNTADRSLAIVDYALRRRFRFISLKPNFNSTFIAFLSTQGFTEGFARAIADKVIGLNEKINKDKNLGGGFEIGHSFFCGELNGKAENAWFEDIVKYEIAPLLEEYWFDDLDKAQKETEALLSK